MELNEAYLALGLEEGCSYGEIKKAYRQMAMQTHPDAGGDAEDFKYVNDAYTTLSKIVGERRLVVMDNIQKCLNNFGWLDQTERMFLANFVGEYYLRGDSNKLIPVENLTTQEFNRLHKIANKPWR